MNMNKIKIIRNKITILGENTTHCFEYYLFIYGKLPLENFRYESSVRMNASIVNLIYLSGRECRLFVSIRMTLIRISVILSNV